MEMTSEGEFLHRARHFFILMNFSAAVILTVATFLARNLATGRAWAYAM